MKARFESAHRSQIQRQKVEEQRAVRLRRQRHHFPFLILARVVVDPLQVCGLSAQTWTVVHQLAVNFARRKIDERHFVLTRFSSKTYSTRLKPQPNLGVNRTRPSFRGLPARGISSPFSRRGTVCRARVSLRLVPCDHKFAPISSRNKSIGCSALPVSATTPIPAQPIFRHCSRLVTTRHFADPGPGPSVASSRDTSEQPLTSGAFRLTF